jgi:hypothetical protein
MKRLLALVLVVALPVLLVADEKKADTKPNTLTPQEVRDGWLLLFDGETNFGWKIDGEAKIENGFLILGGERATKAEVSTAFCKCSVALNATWEHKATPKDAWKKIASMTTTRSSGVLMSDHPSKTPAGLHPATHPRVTVTLPAGTRILLQNVKLRPNYPPPFWSQLLNGKDLTGWKVFEGKGKKSKYTVTPEGWLNVKDGPGDIQTTKLFDNFILQLECISNGDRLNSGIFFRCLPGQYQQGYEAQIHNGWTDTPKKTYTIDEYDPKTHKLLDKKKIQSKAMDYGTGGIYRRMPARFGVAKDKEWFTMTVAAYDRHIATWVNGIQVVDWTDNRPESDNARNGYRGAAGAISIQGHDPTTDLSFRNIRIAELPRVKK